MQRDETKPAWMCRDRDQENLPQPPATALQPTELALRARLDRPVRTDGLCVASCDDDRPPVLLLGGARSQRYRPSAVHDAARTELPVDAALLRDGATGLGNGRSGLAHRQRDDANGQLVVGGSHGFLVDDPLLRVAGICLVPQCRRWIHEWLDFANDEAGIKRIEFGRGWMSEGSGSGLDDLPSTPYPPKC